MKNSIDESYNFLINKWASAEHKGRGVIHCIKPMDFTEIVCKVIAQMRNKNPTIRIFIAVGEWQQRVKLFEKFKAYEIELANITCVTHSYVNPRLNFRFDVGFLIGINQWNHACTTLYWKCKFLMMILTENVIKAEVLSEIYEELKPINNSFSIEELNNYRLSLPVEEERIEVDFDSDQNKETYNKYTDYITQVLQVFGDFNTIAYARKGSPDGRSAEQVLHDLATYNGWSSEMDMNNPFNAKIDACYNPIILGEKARSCYEIMRKRGILVADNNNKLQVIGDILEKEWTDNPNKKFMIISKRGEFASTITNYLNERFGYVCGDYHDKIEPKALVDANGVPVIYKSGANKGKPIIAKSQRICSLNLAAFERGDIKVLSVKNSSNTAICASVGGWILTSPLWETITELRYRFNHIDIDANKLKVYKLYIGGTIEEKALNKEKLSINHVVISDDKKITFADENISDIVC